MDAQNIFGISLFQETNLIKIHHGVIFFSLTGHRPWMYALQGFEFRRWWDPSATVFSKLGLWQILIKSIELIKAHVKSTTIIVV